MQRVVDDACATGAATRVIAASTPATMKPNSLLAVRVSCMFAPETQVPPSETLPVGKRMSRKSVAALALVPDTRALSPYAWLILRELAGRSGSASTAVRDGLSPKMWVYGDMGVWRRIPNHKKRLTDVAEERAGLAAREAQLDQREAQLDLRQAAQEARKHKEYEILMAAEARNEEADARDAEATKRDREADLRSFLDDQAYGVDYVQTRRFAALDRSDSKSDRKAAAEDRSKLTADE